MSGFGVDLVIRAAARALAAGDPLDALNRVALRDDAPALALRGIAMAQVGDLGRARDLVRRASRAFGPAAPVARARCVVAEAEIALASRNLNWPTHALDVARATLEHHGDRLNADHARLLEIRRLLLVGRIAEAEARLAGVREVLPSTLRAVRELVVAGIATRQLRAQVARAALVRARRAAHEAGVPALQHEVEAARSVLDAPAARLVSGGGERVLRLDDVEALIASPALVVDACRLAVRCASRSAALATRPVLFTLARALAEGWPGDVPRASLIARAFRTRRFDETHRARLRVEMGRLRVVLRPFAEVRATSRGFALAPHAAREVAVLAHPVEEAHAALLALVADGEAWSSSALALSLHAHQRTVQRALDELAGRGKVQALGQGRARRWIATPLPGFATTLLLPAVPTAD